MSSCDIGKKSKIILVVRVGFIKHVLVFGLNTIINRKFTIVKKAFLFAVYSALM